MKFDFPAYRGRRSRPILQVIEKSDKRLKGNPARHASLNVDRARSFWLAKRGGRLAIDFEAWGRDHTVLLEFGYSSVQWCDVQKVEEKCHLIVEEHEKYFSICVPSFREVRPPEQGIDLGSFIRVGLDSDSSRCPGSLHHRHGRAGIKGTPSHYQASRLPTYSLPFHLHLVLLPTANAGIFTSVLSASSSFVFRRDSCPDPSLLLPPGIPISGKAGGERENQMFISYAKSSRLTDLTFDTATFLNGLTARTKKAQSAPIDCASSGLQRQR